MAAHEREPANAATPIFLAHGTHDPVVTLERAEASRAKLVDLGYPVRWHTYPMPHSVCAQEIDDISSFLQSVLL
jgi:phospholipase/carboxylesterase